MNKLLILFLVFFFRIKSEGFLYPIAIDKLNNDIYAIYQKNLYDIELLLFNAQDLTYRKLLHSIYTPAGFKLLPDNSGFSFIDQGKIRIKKFLKRSPKTLNLDDLVYDIGFIEWIDDKNFYFTAKKRSRVCIFQGNIEKNKLQCIKEDNAADCMYPQKISDELFYIKRNIDGKYKIIKTYYLNSEIQNTEILDFGNISIAFLCMNSKDEGFFIEHPNEIDKKNENVNFFYHRFFLEKDTYKSEKLFSFSLPVAYLFGSKDTRLYESILPFLPKKYFNKIYFCSSLNNLINVDIFEYDLHNRKIDKKTNSNGENIYFAPIIIKDKAFFGKKVNSSDQLELSSFKL